MGTVKDLTGQQFGYFTVVRFCEIKNGQARWNCRCVCGRTTVVSNSNLRAGRMVSCGCKKSELLRAKNTKHGQNGEIRSPEYGSWMSMKRRCQNPNDKNFKAYGGRGIKICDRWMAFENFLVDMGRRPSTRHTLDRVNNDGNYEPGNCRWATPSEQAKNRRPKAKRL